ncbi:MAG: amino acid adenylation domain-containing protein, partial [Bacteroidota bacterium]
ITLEAMPLTRSGKVDRKALPQTTAALSGQREYIAPTNEMQNTLVRIWQEVLGLEKVGISDSFFQIGGDSILLLNVLSRMKKEMGYELNIGLLYELDTIAALCDHLETASHLHQDRQMWREQAEAWLENVRMAAFEQWPDAAELEDAYPMTDIQKGMVMYSLLQGQQATYHEQFVYEIPRVEVRLFAKAMRRMVKKHAIFRTSFHLSGFEEPMQLVHKSVQVAIDQRDLRHLDQEEQVEQINTYVASERQRPFSFEEGLLWRIALFAISDDKAVMLFQFHHAILDGWSVAAFNTELFQIYLALERDPHFQLAPIRASYRDAVVEEWMEKQHSESRDFWAEKLANYSRLDLFGDGIESKELQKTYEPAYLERLRRRCEAEGIELRTLFLGAFALSLNVLTYEKDDFVIGLVSHNRPIVEDSDQLLGCFLNTLPVKVPLEEWEGKTFANYFQGVEKELKEVRRHSRLTLPEIVRSVGGDAGENNPFFDVLFNYVDFHVYDGIDSDSATGDQLRNDSEEQTMNFSSHDVTNTYLDLNVSVTAGYLTFGYNQEKTLRLGIELEAIHQRVERLLECFVERGAEQMTMADFVGAEERHQLLQEFNDTAFDHPEDLTVVDLFYQQCDRSPDAIALVFGAEQMTYAQVDAYSNQLAHYLQAWCRPQADERIAVLLERGLRMPIALLGILKSGAAYVPLDVRHPQERIDYIASDSACRMVINAMEWAHFEKQRSQFSTDRPDLCPAPGQLAYVLYTSGTTGRPKGVAVEHRSVNNLLHWFADTYRIDEQTCAIQLTDISFDPSVDDLFGTLIKGGSYHIISRELLLDMPALRQYIEERRISILNCVPNVLHQLLVGYTKLKFTQIIISGGEKLPKNTKNQLLQLGYELYNNYGPTEATVDALSGKVGDGAVTIGRPIANAKAYVLGKDLQLLPKGSIGRLYLSGAGLAREYLGREELTRQRFVENPFAKGERMYDTGDLAHWTAEGEMVFLGRMDRQLKIRGHRIEPGEIEKQLTACDGVEAAAVQALEQRGNAFLVAYYTASADVSEESLRQQLAQQLPTYMLPNSFVALTEMPRTANGKIDYRALPAPGEQEQDQFVAPDNEMETKLQAICAETLELEPQHISMHQSFFGLGGHSLKVIELLAAIRKQMGKELAMAEVFAGRSLRQLAQELAQSGAFSTEDELLSLLRQENAEAPHLFFVHDGTGDVQGYVQLCQALKGFNCWGLRSDTLLQVAPQTMSIEDIASRCIQRMQLLQPSGNYRVLGWSTGGLVAME